MWGQGMALAWAIYKGKYHEGTDKADPSTWKTRLRCALNKSTDFQEVPERSQLDISEPYKVYQIVTDRACDAEDSDTQSPGSEDQQGSTAGSPKKEESQKDMLESAHVSPQPWLSGHPTERGCLVRGVFYGWNPTHGQLLPGPQSYLPVEDVNNSDCWLHIRLYYCDVLVKEVTTQPKGREGSRNTKPPSFLVGSQLGTPLEACLLLPPFLCEQRSGPAPLPHAQLAGRRCLSPGSAAKAPG
nr:interferon regulatory factor 4-like [Zonotrichia albicollis]